jgi:glutathione-regulated potassium-efflux system protein KefB
VALGVSVEDAAEVVLDVRRRDAERLQLELAGGLSAGRELMRGNAPKPTPLTTPSREGRALNEETARVTRAERDERMSG